MTAPLERLDVPPAPAASLTSRRSRLGDLGLVAAILGVVALTVASSAEEAPYPALALAVVVAIGSAIHGVLVSDATLRTVRAAILATTVAWLAALVVAALSPSREAPEPRASYLLLTVSVLPALVWIGWLVRGSRTMSGRWSVYLDIATFALGAVAIVIAGAGTRLSDRLEAHDALLMLSSPALLVGVAFAGGVVAASAGRRLWPLDATYLIALGTGLMGAAGMLLAVELEPFGSVRLLWLFVALGVLVVGTGARRLHEVARAPASAHPRAEAVGRSLPVITTVVAASSLFPLIENSSVILHSTQTAAVIGAVVLVAVRQHVLLREREALLTSTTESARREREAHEVARRSAADARATADRLAEAEARYRALVERIPAVVYIDSIDPRAPSERYTPVYLSPQVAELTGYAPDAFTRHGGLWDELVHPDDAAELDRQYVRHARDGQPLLVTYRLTHRDGRLLWVEEHASIIGETPDGHRLSQGVIVDITERRALEDQLRAAQRMDAVGRLAGGVAHDFNNLLTAIVGYSSLLLADLPDEDGRRPDVQAIADAADSATALVRQLLAFGRRQLLRPEEVDVSAVSERVAPLLRRLIGEHLELRTELAADLPAVRADPGQLEQVVVNLVVNARDAMPGGGVVTVRTAETVIGATEARSQLGLQPGNYVALTVTDTGIGMDRTTRERVFEPFFTTKEAGRGTGLGLATVYGIVKQTGGYIGVTSEPGRGSEFRVLLPPLPRPVDATAGAAPRERPELTGGDERVLLVEDEEAVRDLAATVLRRVGYSVVEARAGTEALGILEDRDGDVDLVLSDVVMPELGGPELARRIRARWPHIRVVLMSGYADEIVGRDGTGEEAAFLAKPFAPDALTQLVRSVLDQRSERPSNASSAATVAAGMGIGRSEP